MFFICKTLDLQKCPFYHESAFSEVTLFAQILNGQSKKKRVWMLKTNKTDII